MRRAVNSILAITSELPWPLDTGGHIRSFHLLTGLARQFQVRLVAGVTRPQADGVTALERGGVRVQPVALGRRRPLDEAARLLSAAIRREPYVLYRRHDRSEMRAAVAAAIAAERPDVLYLDHLDSAVFADLLPGGRVVADLHNVYSLIADRASHEHASRAGRVFLRREARLLARVERRLAGRAAALMTVSDEECRHFTSIGGRAVHLVPNGVDCRQYARLATGRPGASPLILYIGTMSWAPNASAARYLATEVLPAVRARIPSARLRIVGKNPPADLQRLHGLDGVEVTGGVPDVVPHLAEAALLAVPLETGGGTRLKILEAFAAGLPVVSTAVGAEGIACTPDRHLVVAERAAFAPRIVSLLADESTGVALAAEGRDLVRRTYDWPVVVSAAVAAIARIGQAPPAIGQRLEPVRAPDSRTFVCPRGD
jgi:glycosyltransferase involved in cell wall biosynthesis